MTLQPIGRQKFSGTPAPASLVNATIALPLVLIGTVADHILSLGEFRGSSFIVVSFLLWNIGLCFMWSRVKKIEIISTLFLSTTPLQWGWIGTMVSSTFFSEQFEGRDGYLIALFAVFAAVVFSVTRSSLKNNLVDSRFLSLGVAIMAAMIWHGVADWSSTGNTAFSKGRLSAKNLTDGQLSTADLSDSTSNVGKFFKKGTRTKLEWAYSGEAGPDMWGSLTEANAACSKGHEQAPVDVPARTMALNGDVQLNWISETGSIMNDGRVLKVKLSGKSESTILGQNYKLKSIDFHSPSEHQLSGFGYPLEVQFVHETSAGQFAIVAVFVEIGESHPDYKPIISVMPTKVSSAVIETPELNLKALIPKLLDVYRYRGSLTTPPCSENVVWSIVAKPIQLSQEQVTTLRRVIPANARPIQPMGARHFDSTNVGFAH